MAGTSAWRVNDVVAYDVVRESASALIGFSMSVARSRPSTEGVPKEVAQLHEEIATTDPYDRAAVSTLAARIDHQLRELSQAAE